MHQDPHCQRTPVVAALLIATLTLVGCRYPRDDDGWEPNNDPASATPLAPGAPITARANQDDPDVFRIDLDSPASLRVLIEDLGLEKLPSFTLTGPDGEDRYRDGTFISHRPPRPEHCDERTTMTAVGEDFILRVEDAAPGAWYLTVREMGAADNTLLFSWDYRVTANLE